MTDTNVADYSKKWQLVGEALAPDGYFLAISPNNLHSKLSAILKDRRGKKVAQEVKPLEFRFGASSLDMEVQGEYLKVVPKWRGDTFEDFHDRIRLRMYPSIVSNTPCTYEMQKDGSFKVPVTDIKEAVIAWQLMQS